MIEDKIENIATMQQPNIGMATAPSSDEQALFPNINTVDPHVLLSNPFGTR